MLSEIDFVKSKLNDVGYQEMLYSKLLPFIIEIEGKKTMVLFTDRRHYEKVLLRFRNRTIPWSASSLDLGLIENLWGILRRKVYD